MLEQFFRIMAGIDNFDQVAQPADLPIGTVRLFVSPMRREPEFIAAMHFACADLHLNPHRIFIHQRCVQAAISVVLRGRDIVFELAWQELPCRVQNAHRTVTIGLVLRDDTESHDVCDLFKADMPLGHLVPDRIRVLFAAGYLDGQTRFSQSLFDL